MPKILKPEIKEAWLAALRSGEYKQGTSALKNGGKFCCLGVLCDLHSKAGLGKWHKGLYKPDDLPMSEASGGYLRTPVLEWACEPEALREENLKLAGDTAGVHALRQSFVVLPTKGPLTGHDSYGLAHINDRGTPFSEIADLIEAQL